MKTTLKPHTVNRRKAIRDGLRKKARLQDHKSAKGATSKLRSWRKYAKRAPAAGYARCSGQSGF